jgi:hypothetical protein
MINAVYYPFNIGLSDLANDWGEYWLKRFIKDSARRIPPMSPCAVKVGATVVALFALNVRESPDGVVMGVVPAVTTGTVREGPRITSDGTTWWYIAYNDASTTIGWSAAADPNTMQGYLAVVGPPNGPCIDPTSFDAVADFSITDNPHGVWSYGAYSAFQTTLPLYTVAEQNSGGVTGLDIRNFGGFLAPPYIIHNSSSENIGDQFGDTIPPTLLDLHPTTSQYSVVRWNAPTTGSYSITGRFEGLQHGLPAGTTTDVHVLLNGASIFDDSVSGFGATAPFAGIQSLNANDLLDFVVGYGPGIGDSAQDHDDTGLAATISPVTVVYRNNFDGAVGSEWVPTGTDVTPTGRRFLGQFTGADSVNLTFGTLGPHSHVTVVFDLFVLKSWDGSQVFHPQFGGILGPDAWDLSVTGGPTLLHTTFSNIDQAGLYFSQAYPGAYPGSTNAPRTGAVETNSLGYASFGDSVYHLAFTFAHTGSTLQLVFSSSMVDGTGSDTIDNESWGLDNVGVAIR